MIDVYLSYTSNKVTLSFMLSSSYKLYFFYTVDCGTFHFLNIKGNTYLDCYLNFTFQDSKEQVYRYSHQLEWRSWILRDCWNNSDKANLENWTLYTWLMLWLEDRMVYTKKHPLIIVISVYLTDETAAWCCNYLEENVN